MFIATGFNPWYKIKCKPVLAGFSIAQPKIMTKQNLRIIKRIFYHIHMRHLVFVLMISLSLNTNAQAVSPEHISLFGNFGNIETPSARFGNDKELNLSISYLPEKYRVLRSRPFAFSEWHYNASLVFIPFIEVAASLIRPDNIRDEAWGIGDRSYKIRFLLLKEKKYLPNLVFGIHDPMGANTHQGAVYFVGSKLINLKQNLSLDVTAGYAFNIENSFWHELPVFHYDSTFSATRLKGVFGGVILKHKTFTLLAEYDSNKFNTGLSYCFLKHFSAQILLLGLDEFSFGVGFRYRFGNSVIPSPKKPFST